jgi:hypothetical protein
MLARLKMVLYHWGLVDVAVSCEVWGAADRSTQHGAIRSSHHGVEGVILAGL